MNRVLSSVCTTYRDRGALVLVCAVANLCWAEIYRHILGRRYLEKKIHNYHMLIDLEDPGISRSLLLFGTREIDHKILLERIVRSDMMIFDIGANIGYYPLMELKLLRHNGRLIAIEPSSENIRLLKKNLARNGYGNKVTVIEGAVSNTSGSAKFHLSSHSNLGTFHPNGSAAHLIAAETINVRTYTIPELASQYGRPDLIRMDVEGHEVEIISGMIEAINSGEMRPTVIFETHLTRYSEAHNMAGTLEDLFACGYHVPFAATSWQSGTKIVEARGYVGGDPIFTDGVERVIVPNIAPDDAIDFICRTGGLRTVVLAPTD